MREQIRMKLPTKIGGLIKEGLIDKIIIKQEHRDIIITIQDSKEFDKDYEEGRILVKMKSS